jgi:3-deoxy-7-phosphoheptulonate synthase
MIIVMKAGATQKQIEHVFEKVKELGFKVHPIYGELRTVVACVGDERGKYRLQALDSLDGVENVVPILKPFKLASSEWHGSRTSIIVPSPEKGKPPVVIGNDTFVVMAGPCSVESREQILLTAEAVKKAGAKVLRGGAFKPRTSPYSFQGLEEEGLKPDC